MELKSTVEYNKPVFKFREVDNKTKKIFDRFIGTVTISTKKAKLSRLIKDEKIEGKHVKFWIDTLNKIVGMEFYADPADKTLPIHYSTHNTYVNLPLEIQEVMDKILPKRKSGFRQKNYPYFKYTSFWCFSYAEPIEQWSEKYVAE